MGAGFLFARTSNSMQAQNQMTINEKIKTTEFILAITLVYLGFQLEEIEDGAVSTQKVFVFRYDDRLEAAISMFWNDEHLCEPKSFWDCARQLKSRMRSTQRFPATQS